MVIMVSKSVSFQVTLALSAIILTSLVCSQSTTPKYYDITYDTLNGSIPVVDLCVAGKSASCTSMTLDQATVVCKKAYTTEKGYITFTFKKIVEPKCDGGTCHVVIDADQEGWYADFACKQGANATALCSCRVYSSGSD
uniref:Uncharacterized protein n=1 Tax=Cacopsylla melanoneura TaxID=428564 RepID=A0A8D8TR69_9HEMI